MSAWSRAALRTDRIGLAVEPAAGDRLGNLHPQGLSWYASSFLVCTPASLSQPGRAGVGAQAGPKRLLEVFAAAGFNGRVAATTAFNPVVGARR